MNSAETNRSGITRFASPGFDVVSVPAAGLQNFSLTGRAGENGAGSLSWRDAAEFLRSRKAAVVSQRVFSGRDPHLSDGALSPGERCAPASWPVTRLLGNGVGESPLTTFQIHAVAGSPVTPVELDGRIVGGVFEDRDAVYCFLSDLQPENPSASRREQAESTFERMEAALRSAGLSVSHIFRTWFFVDRILDWYAEFNSVRTRFFMDRGLFDGVVPASTGVGAANAAGSALVADVLAMKPKKSSACIRAEDYKISIRDIPSPLQHPATHYRSSFSRAVEIRVREQRRLYVSGTAAITLDGKTAHLGDVEKQTALTLEVVERILDSRAMNWSDVTRAVVYFKDIANTPVFETLRRDRRLPDFPVAVAAADICRDDLLFEIEVDAVVGG